jgi:hypothetical protein
VLHRNGRRAVEVDGKTLSVSAVTAAARDIGVDVHLSKDTAVKVPIFLASLLW